LQLTIDFDIIFRNHGFVAKTHYLMEVLSTLELSDGGDRTDTVGRKSNAQDADSLKEGDEGDKTKMEALSPMSPPEIGDYTGTIERKSNAQDADSLSWKFVGVQVVILGTAVAWCNGSNSLYWGCVCVLPSLFIAVIVWATTLDRRCSLWPLRLSIVTTVTTFVQGVYSSHFWFVVIPAASPAGYGIQAFLTLLFSGVAPLIYKAVLTYRRCLQTQYTADGAMLKASRNMIDQLLAAAPVLLVFALAAFTRLSEYTASIEEYAAHTPHCVHTPDDLGNYNTAFRCTQDPAFPPIAPGLENDDHIEGHLLSGIATLRLFLSPTTYLPFSNATADAATLASSPPMTNHTAVLMMHDFRRFLAVADYEANFSVFIVALAQGVVFIVTLVASQVLVRGSRSTMDDLLQSQVTKAELGAVACTGLNVLLVLVAGSLRGKELGLRNLIMLVLAIAGVVLAQLACLYKLCGDITTGNHSFHGIRAPRLSTVVPQHPEAAAGATRAAPTVETSPVIPFPPAQDGALAMMEGFKKELKKELAVSMNKALEEQKSTAKEQQRASDERAAYMSKALEEQKIVTDERAANLSKALEEQKIAADERAVEQAADLYEAMEKLGKVLSEQAGLVKAFEKQRQKIEYLEAKCLSLTDTHRVPL
jgi:hypothetical protein